MVSHLLDLVSIQRMGNHCYYFVIVLVLVIRIICCIVLANLHAGLSFIQSSWAYREFALVLRLISKRVELELR